LAKLLASFDYTCSFVEIRNESNLLHLKSGIAYLGVDRLVVTEAFAGRADFAGYDQVIVNSAEIRGSLP
jgi:hypothetical protein